MSVQRFLNLQESLEFLNSLDSDEIDFEIALLPTDASELTDEDEWNENDVNSREITENDVPGSLVVKT
ncbi:hypothetical protein TNCV_4936741 [Trichonephila clavipes]|nr:hypothetical protein TNCV_4936741 [Trichonephila clavipes]